MKNIDNIYTLDGKVPLAKALPFGFQHILTMFAANITPIMILAGICDFSPQMKATLIQNAMLIAGIGTLIQIFPIFGIGSRLPVVMGLSFSFLSVSALISVQYGYNAVLGAVFGVAIATLPSAVIGGCMVMVLGMIFVAGIGMVGKYAFSQRNILITSLSISIGIGFTQVPELLVIFPDLVKNIIGENCVVLVFLISAFLNIVLPKDMDFEGKK